MLASAQHALTGFKQSAVKDFDIEQGPSFLRFISFCTAAASLGCAIFKMVMITEGIAHPVEYIVYAYLAIFALSTMLFEAKHEWIEKLGPLSRYQDMLIKNCGFLNLMAGRGIFYIFQATLWLSVANDFSEVLFIACAGAMGLMGVLHIFAHWGLMPHEIAKKAIHVVEKVANKDIDGDGKVGAP